MSKKVANCLFFLVFFNSSFTASCGFLLTNPLNSVSNCICFILLERQCKKCLAQMLVLLVHCSSSCTVRLFWKARWHRFEKTPELCFVRSNQQSALQNGHVNSCVGITGAVVNWEVRIKKKCYSLGTFQPEFSAKENACRAIPPPLWVLC